VRVVDEEPGLGDVVAFSHGMKVRGPSAQVDVRIGDRPPRISRRAASSVSRRGFVPARTRRIPFQFGPSVASMATCGPVVWRMHHSSGGTLASVNPWRVRNSLYAVFRGSSNLSGSSIKDLIAVYSLIASNRSPEWIRQCTI
jgi:hypothetical protein